MGRVRFMWLALDQGYDAEHVFTHYRRNNLQLKVLRPLRFVVRSVRLTTHVLLIFIGQREGLRFGDFTTTVFDNREAVYFRVFHVVIC